MIIVYIFLNVIFKKKEFLITIRCKITITMLHDTDPPKTYHLHQLCTLTKNIYCELNIIYSKICNLEDKSQR